MNSLDADGPVWATFARRVIERIARQEDPSDADPPAFEPRDHGGVFVTLHKSGRLRGCMGILDSSVALPEAIRAAAVCAASEDPRFPRVSASELGLIDVEISIMSAPRPMGSVDELEIGRHGVIVRRGTRRGLFLPQVAVEHHMDKETFLARCCTEKAGLPATAWREPDTEVLTFTASVYHET